MIGLALLISAAAPPPVMMSDCSMGECGWFRKQARETVLRKRDGDLIRYTVLEGRSRHPDDKYPKAYSPRLRVRFRKKTYYAFCSRSRPSLAFRAEIGPDRGKWIAHLLNFDDLYGYNSSSAVIYLAACHGAYVMDEGLGPILRRLGYERGTPSAQIELRTPTDLADPNYVARAMKRSGEDIGSRH